MASKRINSLENEDFDIESKLKELPNKKNPNRKMLTLFLIIFPSILIAGNYGSLLSSLAIKAGLIFYQFVLLKSFLENYYKLIE